MTVALIDNQGKRFSENDCDTPLYLEFAEVLVLVCEDSVLALELLLQGRHLI